MPDVNTAQLPALMSALTSAENNYHIGIIAAGDFLTNDQTGAALPGNSYANMNTLLGLASIPVATTT
jgi:serralysin